MSSHNNSSTAANDPRQPYTAKPFVAPAVSAKDLPVDYSGFIAVIFGIAGVMFRQISMAMMFAIMGLVTNYLGPTRPGTQG